MQQYSNNRCQIVMRIFLLLLLVLFFACRRGGINCDNATVYKPSRCGVDWEVEFSGQRYPVDSLPESLKRDSNSIYVSQYHFYDDPTLCPCCGYRHLVVESAVDEMTCIPL